MQLKNLSYFQNVVRAQSISKAAQDIFISQQGLSKAIQSIEKELNVCLLKRNESGKTVPTEAGQELLAASKEILETWDSLKESMTHFNEDGSKSSEVPRAHVYLTTYLANSLFFVFGKHTYQEKISGEAVVFEKSHEEIFDCLTTGDVDVVAMVNINEALEERIKQEGVLEFEPVLRMELLIKCSPDFVVGKKKSLDVTTLRSLPLAVYKEPMLSVVLDTAFRMSTLNVIMHTTNYHQILEAVVCGDAATFTDTFKEYSLNIDMAYRSAVKNYVCIPLEEPVRFSAGFLAVKGAKRSEECLKYEEFCKNRIMLKYGSYVRQHPCDAGHREAR